MASAWLASTRAVVLTKGGSRLLVSALWLDKMEQKKI